MAGYGSLASMAVWLLLPSAAALAVTAALGYTTGTGWARLVVFGGLAGLIATGPLEVIRLAGFQLEYMPGNLPRLMGVLLLDRFALGPSFASDIAGWSYHFWNGVCFGVLYVVTFGTARRWLAVLYGVALGVGFMVSPVVTSLGIGRFGLEYSVGFPITVTLAHVAFGATLGLLSTRLAGRRDSPWLQILRSLLAASGMTTGKNQTKTTVL